MADFQLAGYLEILSFQGVDRAVKQLRQELNSIQPINIVNTGKLDEGSKSASKMRKEIDGVSVAVKTAANATQDFADKAALALRRFTAFSVAAGVTYGTARAVLGGLREASNYERQLIKVQQITNASATSINQLTSEIARLGSSLGAPASELADISIILTKAGISINQVRTILESVARTRLAASFTDVKSAGEGILAVLGQFQVPADQVADSLALINSTASHFAVSSDDLINAIKRTGGAFASASAGIVEGNEALAQFNALVGSVKQTTQQSPEAISTGLRTVITRLQRPETSKYFEGLGVNIRDQQGNFIGVYQAIQKISEAFEKVNPLSQEFAKTVDILGGARQLAVVVPLLKERTLQQQILNKALQDEANFISETNKPLETISSQFERLSKSWDNFTRDVYNTPVFQIIAKDALSFANSLVKILDNLAAIVPLLTVIGGLKLANSILNEGAIGSFVTRIKTGRTEPDVLHRATGGFIPGVGYGDKIPILAEPGEFVIRKDAATKIGAKKLYDLNNIDRYAAGGFIGTMKRYEGGGTVQNQFVSQAKDLGIGYGFIDQIIKEVTQATKGLADATLKASEEARLYAGALQAARYNISKNQPNLAGGGTNTGGILGDLIEGARKDSSREELFEKFSPKEDNSLEKLKDTISEKATDKTFEEISKSLKGGGTTAGKLNIPLTEGAKNELQSNNAISRNQEIILRQQQDIHSQRVTSQARNIFGDQSLLDKAGLNKDTRFLSQQEITEQERRLAKIEAPGRARNYVPSGEPDFPVPLDFRKQQTNRIAELARTQGAAYPLLDDSIYTSRSSSGPTRYVDRRGDIQDLSSPLSRIRRPGGNRLTFSNSQSPSSYIPLSIVGDKELDLTSYFQKQADAKIFNKKFGISQNVDVTENDLSKIFPNKRERFFNFQQIPTLSSALPTFAKGANFLKGFGTNTLKELGGPTGLILGAIAADQGLPKLGVGKRTTSVISGLLGGAAAGAAIGGPYAGVTALAGGLYGGVNAFVSGSHQDEVTKAQKELADSSKDLDKAFKNLSRGGIVVLNAAIERRLNAAQNLTSTENQGFGAQLSRSLSDGSFVGRGDVLFGVGGVGTAGLAGYGGTALGAAGVAGVGAAAGLGTFYGGQAIYRAATGYNYTQYDKNGKRIDSGNYGYNAGLSFAGGFEDENQRKAAEETASKNTEFAGQSRGAILRLLRLGQEKNISDDLLLGASSDRADLNLGNRRGRVENSRTEILPELKKQVDRENSFNLAIEGIDTFQSKLAKTASYFEILNTVLANNANAVQNSFNVAQGNYSTNKNFNNTFSNIDGLSKNQIAETLSGIEDFSRQSNGKGVNISNDLKQTLLAIPELNHIDEIINKQVKKGGGGNGDEDSLRALTTNILNDKQEGLGNLPASIKKQVSLLFEGLDTSRLQDVIGGRDKEFFNSIKQIGDGAKNVAKAMQEAQNKILQDLQIGVNNRSQLLTQRGNLDYNLNSANAAGIELDRQVRGERPDSALSIGLQQQTIGSLTGGVIDPNQIANNIRALQSQKEGLESGNLTESTGFKLSEVNSALAKNKQALDELARSALGLSAIQNELSDLERRRSETSNIVENDVLGGNQRQTFKGRLALAAFEQGGDHGLFDVFHGGGTNRDLQEGINRRRQELSANGSPKELEDFNRKIDTALNKQGVGVGFISTADGAANDKNLNNQAIDKLRDTIDASIANQLDAIKAQRSLLDDNITKFDQVLQNKFINGIQEFNKIVENFSIPDIKADFTHHHEIQVNGLDIWKQAEPYFKAIAEKTTEAMINKLTEGREK